MQVSVVPLTNFVHGAVTAHEGRPMAMNETLARDLERRGLVRVKLAPDRAAKPQAASAGKATDDGRGQLSSVSPAAPPLQTKTLRSSKPGGGKLRKAGK